MKQPQGQRLEPCEAQGKWSGLYDSPRASLPESWTPSLAEHPPPTTQVPSRSYQYSAGPSNQVATTWLFYSSKFQSSEDLAQLQAQIVLCFLSEPGSGSSDSGVVKCLCSSKVPLLRPMCL